MTTNGVSKNGLLEEPGWLPVDPDFATTAIHSGYKPGDDPKGAVVPPIYLAATFKQDGPGEHRGYMYSRCGNPTRAALEKTLAALDKGKHGFVYSSGQGAAMNVISLVKTGEHVIVEDDVYSGTGTLFREYGKSNGIEVEFVDLTDLSALENALKPNTKLVWIETPTNPTLKVIDITKVTKAVRRFSQDVIVAVDNTLLSPYFQRPLTLGADLSVYSLTKYMNGHSDVIMGSVVASRDDLAQRLRFLQNALGAVPSPFDCYNVNRGLKTLHIRMPLHMKNALQVAKYLESHPKVEKVLHPGLPSHPQHQLALEQSSGHSGLIAFYMKEGAGSPAKFLQNLRLFTLALSLGGYESLAELPKKMTHASVPADLSAKLGITDHLIRLSIGLEAERDLVYDLKQAFNNC